LRGALSVALFQQPEVSSAFANAEVLLALFLAAPVPLSGLI
jgi:hypothetical protein